MRKNVGGDQGVLLKKTTAKTCNEYIVEYSGKTKLEPNHLMLRFIPSCDFVQVCKVGSATDRKLLRKTEIQGSE